MRDRRMRLALAAVAASAIAAGAAFAAGSSGRETALPAVPTATGGGEMPSALDRHLAQLSKTIPGNGGEPGESTSLSGSSAAMQDFIELAYPKSDIPLSSIKAARRAIAAAQARSPGRRKGQWVQVGPQTALYPFTPLRNAPATCRTSTGRGRTTDLAIDRTAGCRVRTAACGSRLRAGASGARRTRSILSRSGSTCRAASGSTRSARSRSTRTIRAGTRSGSARARGTRAAAAASPASASTSRRTAATRGLVHSASVFNARGVGTIAIEPGGPNTILRGSTRGVRGHARRAATAVSQYGPDPGRAVWGLYSRRTAERRGRSSTTVDERGRVRDRVRAIANNATPCSPRGVRRVVFDPSNPNIVYAASYARGVWRSSDGGATWTQIKPSLNAAITTTRPEIAVTTLPNGKTRMYVGEGHTGAPTYSRLFRSDDVATGAPVFTNLTSNDPSTSRATGRSTTVPASAGTTTSSTRRPGIRTSCMSAARTSTARRREPPRRCCSRPMPARRSTT